MEVDYGLLSALRGRTNWADIKAEKQAELGYQSVLNRMQEEQNLAQQQKQAAINEYLQAAGKLNVLPKGMDRIREINEPLVQGIAENIKKYNGDVDKYMQVQGQVDLNHYLNSLMNHPTTVKELMNASAASKYFADKNLGRQERGEVDPLTGNLLNPFESQLAKYNSGDVDTLNYGGSFEFPDFDTKVFGENYGNPSNPYQVVPVGAETLSEYAYNEFKKKGLDDKDARQAALQYASQYGQALKNPKFQPYTFKHDTYHAPNNFSVGEANKLQDAKYLLEQLGAAMSGHPDTYKTSTEGFEDENGNFYTGDEVKQQVASEFKPDETLGSWVGNIFKGDDKESKYVDKEGNKYTQAEFEKKASEIAAKKYKPATVVTGDALVNIPIGKFSYSYYPKNADGTFKNTDESGNGIATVTEKDDLIKGWKYKNGKAYIKTTQSQENAGGTLDGKKVDNQGFTEATDNILTAIAKALNIPLHAVRKSLVEGNAYDTKTPETSKMAGAKGGTYKGLDEHGNPIFE